MQAAALFAEDGAPLRGEDRQGHGPQSLPLRHLSAHPRRARQARQGRGRAVSAGLTRREFLKYSGAGLTLAVVFSPFGIRVAGAEAAAGRLPPQRLADRAPGRQRDHRRRQVGDGAGGLHVAADDRRRRARRGLEAGRDRGRPGARRVQGPPVRHAGHRGEHQRQAHVRAAAEGRARRRGSCSSRRPRSAGGCRRASAPPRPGVVTHTPSRPHGDATASCAPRPR